MRRPPFHWKPTIPQDLKRQEEGEAGDAAPRAANRRELFPET
jgi:hypothetical protein